MGWTDRAPAPNGCRWGPGSTRSTSPSRKTEAGLACTIGIDTGKNTLHLIGLDAKGAVVSREKLARGRIAARLANVPPCLIDIEAGMSTHYVARELLVLGHDVRQVPPSYAKPFRQGHKNDFRDVYAIAEAVQRPSTRCVTVKTGAQLELQALHPEMGCCSHGGGREYGSLSAIGPRRAGPPGRTIGTIDTAWEIALGAGSKQSPGRTRGSLDLTRERPKVEGQSSYPGYN